MGGFQVGWRAIGRLGMCGGAGASSRAWGHGSGGRPWSVLWSAGTGVRRRWDRLARKCEATGGHQ